MTTPSWTMRLPERSSGSTSPRFSCQSRSRAVSSSPVMMRASEPPMKRRRSFGKVSAAPSDIASSDAWRIVPDICTVTRIENGADAKQSTMDRLQRALEAAGVEFTNGDQPGVRLAKAPAAGSAKPATATAAAVRGKTAKATQKKR